MNILNKLTIKHLKMNKKRTIVSIVGIVLSTALMVGLGLLFASLHQMMIDSIVSFKGDQHVYLSPIEKEDIKYIENNANVEKIYWQEIIGYDVQQNRNLSLESYNGEALANHKLKSGRMPKNQNEVLIYNGDIDNLRESKLPYQINDKIKLTLHDRYALNEEGKLYLLGPKNPIYKDEETWKEKGKREVTIVGILEGNSKSYETISMVTKLDKSQITGNLTAGIIYKNVTKVPTYTDQIVSQLQNNDIVLIDYNNSLLALYGASSYDNINSVMTGMIIFLLTLISIGCSIVIYNSFAISVMERKKQFGLFSSIGATSRQIRKTVYFEAFIVGTIGIVLGLLGAFLGIFTLLQVVNYLIGELFGFDFKLVIYPAFIIIPVIFMIITVFISSYLPARRASKINPIEAIRLNDDIKIKNKKVKTSGLIRKIFGVEGDLALKNIKRNKRKYRITVISLFISIVLFISFSTFVEYGMSTSNTVMDVRDYDIIVNFYENNLEKINPIINDIKKISGITDQLLIQQTGLSADVDQKYLTEEYQEKVRWENGPYPAYISIITLSDDDMKKFLLQNHLSESILTEDMAVLINRQLLYGDNLSTAFVVPFRDTLKELTFTYENQQSQNETYHTNIVMAPSIPKLLEKDRSAPTLFVSHEVFEKLSQGVQHSSAIQWLIKAKDHKSVEKELEALQEQHGSSSFEILNITAAMQMQKNMVLVIGILLYGFITLVTLIGVTSVFNTINTSMQLRRKEFAVLRSVGLSPKGFNKMLRLESIFYGLKSLLYALPVSFLMIVWLNSIFGDIIDYGLLIPWNSIIIAILAVFIITFITMNYATKKIKKENILEAIREENI